MDEGRMQRPIISAGGAVVVRRTRAGARIAVMEAGGIASLPRAEVGPGESAESAARRAATAFVGDGVRLTRTLGQSRERTSQDEVLTWFWLARSGRRDLEVGAGDSPGVEGFSVVWMELEAAIAALDSPEEAALLEQLTGTDLRPRGALAASVGERALRAELRSLRDRYHSGHAVDLGADPDQALAAAQLELRRAERRLSTGDLAGARRAQARAERAGLLALDPAGCRVAFGRLWRALPREVALELGLPQPPPGAAPPMADLLTLHDAVEALALEREHALESRRGHELRLALALVSTVGAMAVLSLGLAAPHRIAVDTPTGLALQAALIGALGGWSGQALRSLVGEVPGRRTALALAGGAAAGLAVGAAMTAGLEELPGGGRLMLVAAASYAAGWFGAGRLPGDED